MFLRKGKNKIILLLSFLLAQTLWGQSHIQIELDWGLSFQKEMSLGNESLDNARTSTLLFGAYYQWAFSQQFYLETGLGGRYNRGKKSIEAVRFKTQSLKIYLPIVVAYQLNRRWEFGIGAIGENNLNLDSFHARKPQNLRFYVLLKSHYHYSDRLSILLSSHWTMGRLSTVHTFDSPRNGVYLGLAYQLFEFNKKQKK